MSVAQQLPEVVPMFMQDCPLCGRSNRMVVKGVYIKDDKAELYPDIGYSFCNCKSIFYTDYENVKVKTHSGIQHYRHPLKELGNIFNSLPNGDNLELCIPDPFFCEWGNNPYTFEHWNPRFNHVLFDMEQLCEDSKEIGFEVISSEREFDMASEHPKTMRILLRKP